MKTVQELETMLTAVESDQRLFYKTANIVINAPLALIQLSLEVQSDTLRKVLGMPMLNFKKLRGDKE